MVKFGSIKVAISPSYKWLLLVVAFVAVLFLAATLTVDDSLRSYKYRQITGLSAVKDLSDNGSRVLPTGAHLALIAVETQNVRYRDGHSDGSLTTRTDFNTGVITVTDSDHGIADTDTVFVWWSNGVARSMDVSTVAGNLITVDAGAGQNLPALGTAVEIGIDPTSTVGVLITAGNEVWYSGPIHRFRAIETTASAKISLIPYGGRR